MPTNMPEDAVRRILETFYQQRAERLQVLELGDILPSTPSVFWSLDPQSAVEIVRTLIEVYLSGFEEWWTELIQDAAFCPKAIRIRQDITTQRFAYEHQLANVRNRLTLQFINRYCTPSYDVAWDRLVRFDSSKDR